MAHGQIPLNGPPLSPKKSTKSAYTAQVDSRGPVSATVVIGAFVTLTLLSGPAKPESELPWTLNPTGYLRGVAYFMLYFCSIPAKELANTMLNAVAKLLFNFRRMDEGKFVVKKLEVLENVDLIYLALNTTVEYIGMNHIVNFLLYGPSLHRLNSFCLMNGPIAFVVVMCINDIIYYPFHLVAHKREFYAYCHKQHHRQFVPFRGYADAANQHPLEQLYGFCIFIGSLHLTSRLTGLHAATAWCCFLAWAILNIANHLAFDSNIHLPLPYPAFPRDHQMHHRFPQCNYSTLTSFCDRAGGTYKRYKEFGEKESRAPAGARPEALPSPYSVVSLLVGLVLAAFSVEAFHLGGLPDVHELKHFQQSALLLSGVAVCCVALGVPTMKGPPEEEGPKGCKAE